MVKKKLADSMTPEELRALADKKEEEARWKTIKRATLKHDLFLLREKRIYGNWVNEKELEEIKNNLYIMHVPKGTEFECIMLDNKWNMWFDCDGVGLEEMSDEWANENLENIESVGS